MGSRYVFDVSYFFAFEVMDDSEFGLDSPPAVEGARVVDDDAADDAESCCFDSSHVSNCDTTLLRMDDQENLELSRKRIEDEENDDEQGENIVLVKVEEEEELKSEAATSMNSSISSVKQQPIMTEMEKSRRFWESCLAS